MKKVFTIVMVAWLVLSCSNEGDFDSKVNNLVKKEVLGFSSLEEMEKKIDEIIALKDEKELNISKEIFFHDERNQLAADLKKISYDDIKGDLEFYHNKKLKSIYDLRQKLGFVSLQSIVDEINSLKLLDPDKAEQLYLDHKRFLTKSKFKISSAFDEELSNILNKEAKVVIDEELIDLNSSEEIEKTFDRSVSLKNNSQLAKSAGFIQNDFGVLAVNNLFLVTWQVGKKRNRSNIFHRYDYFTKIGGFIRTSDNNYISYPISWQLESQSYCRFRGIRVSGYIEIGFPNNWTNVTYRTNRGYSTSRNFQIERIFISKGVFSTVIGNETYSILSEPFYRDYDNYDPDEPPLYD